MYDICCVKNADWLCVFATPGFVLLLYVYVYHILYVHVVRATAAFVLFQNMTMHFLQTGCIKVCFAYNKQLYYLPLIMVLKVLL